MVPCVWIYALIYGNAIVVIKLYIRISGIEYIKETVLLYIDIIEERKSDNG